ncbi:hypothetical protein HC891_08690 [Candidatus Gracilibacteria bacterium]|nr:hypothetical protein [Candidatus Gracilibacteria bacterium]
MPQAIEGSLATPMISPFLPSIRPILCSPCWLRNCAVSYHRNVRVRSQESGVRSQESGVRSQKVPNSEFGLLNSGFFRPAPPLSHEYATIVAKVCAALDCFLVRARCTL